MFAGPIVGLDDAFGARARDLRAIQRRLLALFDEAGYAEVIPPLLDRPETLKSGAGRFLADQTIVFSDPAGAGLLAIRSDMTPQIARIAATRLQHEPVLRLCYSGTVMLARPESRRGSRQQWQTGVECLGVAGGEGDAEVLELAARSMTAAGFARPVLQVGHIGLLRALLAGDDDAYVALEPWRDVMARRSPEDARAAARAANLDESRTRAVLDMAAGRADAGWLEASLGRFGEAFDRAATELLELAGMASQRLDGAVEVLADAAVMPRFLYHSGIVFAGFAEGVPRALLHGGRYDAMMAAHGRDMPATGFSCDLWSWLDAGAGENGREGATS